ncbi:hypothetical protein CDAR_373511 [Caerostris darwini]|uniref:Uncharacterized protein n=1 Tax=Caerostris darwini TaxID=1538125 RepID=A0AAV4QFS4_9ARAC|nr:hypothetical protein CDAR_373511 [Caerostris darwini]
MFSGRKASRKNIHFSPDRCAFARGYGCYSAEWKIEKRKEKRKLCWNISAFMSQQLPPTHSFIFCDAGSEIGAVLPTVAAPKAGSLAHRFPLALKSPIIFNGHRFTCTLCYLILCIDKRKLLMGGVLSFHAKGKFPQFKCWGWF